MSILRYSQFVNESKNTNKVLDESLNVLENEYLRMKSEGLSESKINENIFSSLLGSLGGGFTDTFKGYIVDWAVEKLGIEPYDEAGEPSFFYRILKNVIEEVSITELGNYFGKGSCKYWAKAIVKGLAESFEEKTLSYLLPKLGISIDMSTGFGGTIAASIREALTNSLNNTKFMSSIEKTISGKICGFNLGDALSGITSGDKRSLETQIKSAETKDPDIFTKLMKTGLSDVLQTA